MPLARYHHNPDVLIFQVSTYVLPSTYPCTTNFFRERSTLIKGLVFGNLKTTRVWLCRIVTLLSGLFSNLQWATLQNHHIYWNIGEMYSCLDFSCQWKCFVTDTLSPLFITQRNIINLSLLSPFYYCIGLLNVKKNKNFIFFFSFSCDVHGIVESSFMTATADASPIEITTPPSIKEHAYRE